MIATFEDVVGNLDDRIGKILIGDFLWYLQGCGILIGLLDELQHNGTFGKVLTIELFGREQVVLEVADFLLLREISVDV